MTSQYHLRLQITRQFPKDCVFFHDTINTVGREGERRSNSDGGVVQVGCEDHKDVDFSGYEVIFDKYEIDDDD